MSARNGTETELEFLSADGKTTVHGYVFTKPEVTPKAILQISHGMQEYIGRYRDFAFFLAENGYVVCGNDHLGHGKTSGDSGTDGYFADRDGYRFVLEDLHTMTLTIKKQYPGLPLYLFGHSMGSFFARLYAVTYPQELTGLIISGTGGPNPAGGVGLFLTSLLSKTKGPRAVSPFIEKLAFGAYCKRIPKEEAVTGKEWVTRSPDIMKAYIADPKCSFRFTVSGYHDMMKVLSLVSTPEWGRAMPKELPVFMLSGAEDPVGGYGVGIRQVEKLMRDGGVKDLTVKLYPTCRHEVHNELQPYRDEMYHDVLGWLDAHPQKE